MPKFFSPEAKQQDQAETKPLIPFEEYIDGIKILATRIKVRPSGEQLYTSAQFELALIAFADLEALKTEMDPDIEVDMPQLSCDWLAGFDWLDLSVSYNDPDAISYFQNNLQQEEFFNAYLHYKTRLRPDCALIKHELNGDEFRASINL